MQKEIELEAHAIKGIGRTHAKWSPVALFGIGCFLRLYYWKILKISWLRNLRQYAQLKYLILKILAKNASRLDSEIIYERDFDYDYFGFKTLERSFLLKVNEKIVVRPQHMLMRVSIGIHKDDIESALQTYHLMSQRWFIHAIPTLFNGGTPQPQLSSSIHNIRAKGSYIRGTNGTSNGIVPMLRVFNSIACYVDQGGGGRKGTFKSSSIAVFMYIVISKKVASPCL